MKLFSIQFATLCCAVTGARHNLRRSLQGGGGPPGGGGGGGGDGGGGGGGGGGATTCSTSLAPDFMGPTVETGNEVCVTLEPGVPTSYPEGFDILNSVARYTCPTSGLRVIVSNGIPDHDLTLNNPNPPCVLPWSFSVPLEPSFSGFNQEPSSQGIIGMSLNGVPCFGAQEGGGTNAVELNSTQQLVQSYGHASPSGAWHYHSGEFGLVTNIDDQPSDLLIGYALDGFPIYGPLEDDSVLDECNGIGTTADTYRYHVRRLTQVDETLGYCSGTSPALNWNYVLGCMKGDLSTTVVGDSTLTTIPADCVLDGADSPSTPAPVTPIPPVDATPSPVVPAPVAATSSPVAPTAAPAAVATPDTPAVDIFGYGYVEPEWYDLIASDTSIVNLKRCVKRNPNGIKELPVNGEACATTPKTCFFGTQTCTSSGAYPDLKCFCDGSTWTCTAVTCAA